MKWAETQWSEPEHYPAVKMMKCDGCGWAVMAEWPDPDHGWHLWAESPDVPGQRSEVEQCPKCGNRLALYKMDLADDGQWHDMPAQ